MPQKRIKNKDELVRLDVIIIKVHRLETKVQLLIRARMLAKEIGKTKGWRQIKIEESEIPAIRDGQRICYFFEVWGRFSCPGHL